MTCHFCCENELGILNRKHTIALHPAFDSVGTVHHARRGMGGKWILPLIACILLMAESRAAAQGNPIHASVLFPQETPLTTALTLQTNLISIIVMDLTGDGQPDVVVASQVPSMVAWYQNTGNGTFGPRRLISTALGYPTGVFAGDLDGDGLVDVACSSFTDNTIAWFKNLGGDPTGGLFGYQPAAPSANLRVISTAATSASAVTIANINTTGGLDVLSTAIGNAIGNSQVAWYGNLGLGTFGSTNLLSNAALSPSSITVADLDGNGILDLVVTSSNDNTIAWFKGTTPVGGNPQFIRYVIASNQPRAAAAAVSDVDGDGWPDLLCASPYSGDASSGPGKRITWLRNTTHGAGATAPFFGAPQVVSANLNGVYSVVAADLNSDGKPDAVAGSILDAKLTWYENFGGGNFGWNALLPAANERLISTGYFDAISVAATDFNQDGTIDVVAGSNTEGKVVVWLNRGGQCALASANTAPAAIGNGKRDDLLRIAVSSRGVAGDNNARLDALTLFIEKSPGVPMTTAEANALIANLHIYLDSNNSNAFELAGDTLVTTVADLQLTNGRQVVTLTGGNASNLLVGPGATRNYFVVAEMASNGSSQSPNTVRITHVGEGAGRSVVKDALSAAVLTLEKPLVADAPSSFVTVQLSAIQTWRQTWFGTTANTGNAADTANPDGDADINMVEFAFGTNPTVGQSNAISVNNGTITPGKPTVRVNNTGGSVIFEALYGRRKDYLTAEMSYTVEFSADLLTWVPSADPTVIAENATMQAVTVPYPFFINGKKAQFFHVIVTMQ